VQDNASPCAMARTDFGATVEFKDSVLSLYRVAASFTDPATTAFQPGSSGACVPAGTSNLDVRNLTCVIQSVECQSIGARSAQIQGAASAELIPTRLDVPHGTLPTSDHSAASVMAVGEVFCIRNLLHSVRDVSSWLVAWSLFHFCQKIGVQW
jgi:hypothetical protein